MNRKFPPLKERLLQATTIDENGCWICSIAVSAKSQYGRVTISGTGIRVKNHRASWMVHRGPIPKGMCVLHRCDTPACINPDHLFLGSQADNSADIVAKGRFPDRRGENGGRAYLTTVEVLKIRSLADMGLYTRRQIGEMCGTNEANVRSIVIRKTWKHI